MLKAVISFATKLVPGGAFLSVLPWAAGAGLVVSGWLYVSHLRSEVVDDEKVINQVVAINQQNTQQLNILKADQKSIDAEDARLVNETRRVQVIAERAKPTINAAANSNQVMTPSEAAALKLVRSYQEGD